MSKCDSNALGIAIGAVSALCMLILSILGLAGYGLDAVASMQEWHVGYDLSALGIIIGIVEAALVGYIGGYLVAWFYNMAAK